MFYFIYETINKINGTKYIGKHATDNLDDGYLGSGLILLKAIKKYGRENFERNILLMCEDNQSLSEAEKEFITQDVINSKEYYNIALGGYGGKIVLDPLHPLYEEVCAKISKSKSSAESRKHNSEYTKKNHREKKVGMYGKKQSEKQKQAAREAQLGRKHSEERRQKQKESYEKTISDPNYIHPNKGRKKTDDMKERSRINTLNRPKKTCPYCGITMDERNYARYHGDKCKRKDKE